MSGGGPDFVYLVHPGKRLVQGERLVHLVLKSMTAWIASTIIDAMAG